MLVVARQPPSEYVQVVGLLDAPPDGLGNEPGARRVARHDLHIDPERRAVLDHAVLEPWSTSALRTVPAAATKALGIGRVLERFPAIVTHLGAITDRFCTVLDCVDSVFVPDPGFLDHLPAPGTLGRTRTGGIDINTPWMRAVLAAVIALAPAAGGFTAAQLVAKVHTMTGDTGYTTRQGAYDLRKLRGKDLIEKPGRTRRYQVTPQAAGTITALLTLRDQIIGPILAGVRSPRPGCKPAVWTQIDRDYETLRVGMQALFHHLGLTPAATSTKDCRSAVY